MRRFIITLIGSFCYTGFFIKAPATFASFVWLVVYLFVPGGRWLTNPVSLVVTLPLSIYLSREMEKFYGEDASQIVIDEFVGMQVTLLLLAPAAGVGVVGFILFRIFDIVKPFPVEDSQRVGGGFGVVLDDLIAGIYSRCVLFVIMRYVSLDLSPFYEWFSVRISAMF